MDTVTVEGVTFQSFNRNNGALVVRDGCVEKKNL